LISGTYIFGARSAATWPRLPPLSIMVFKRIVTRLRRRDPKSTAQELAQPAAVSADEMFARMADLDYELYERPRDDKA